ncbi:uncharacterized protein LOC129972877 isoform X2 [Argiope bruennichi]|uniref:uncharacterized protein LOC129972877 isoform X2 n=1 Tax=Argiope bruennichi TaxID=94029 RepID=UPI0024951271|nr:uncharacterized protein LOC129972877 isoform X2 [Argiope bruennichi]
MDSKTYHFDKGDINLTNAKKNEDEVSSFIENHEANDHKELNYENEFLSINRESFREATIQVLDAKSKLHEEIVNSIITPSTISNPIAVQNQTLDYSEPTNKNYETFKNDVPPRQDEPHRGSVRLVRLQAVSDNQNEHNSKVECDIAVPSTNSAIISTGDLNHGINTHENKTKNEVDSQQIIFSEAECTFLSSHIPSVNQQNLSSNSEENTLITEVSYQSETQNPDPNLVHTSNTTYEQTVFSTSNTTISNLKMPRIEKVQSFSSTDPKVSMWIDNSGDNTSGNMNDNPALQYHENSQDIYQRSRVSDACSALRKMIPGMSEKTDKATVFEQAARYLKFLRDKFGTQFDQAYCEKYFQERS